MVALWARNAASESLEKKKFVSICLGHLGPGPATAFPNLILVQNQPPMVALWVPNAASESLDKKSLFPFVSVIFAPNIQNEPPMVALWAPNAPSESLEKKKFVSICLGHLGPEHLVPPQLFPI